MTSMSTEVQEVVRHASVLPIPTPIPRPIFMRGDQAFLRHEEATEKEVKIVADMMSPERSSLIIFVILGNMIEWIH